MYAIFSAVRHSQVKMSAFPSSVERHLACRRTQSLMKLPGHSKLRNQLAVFV